MNKYWKSSLLLPILLQASISSAIEQQEKSSYLVTEEVKGIHSNKAMEQNFAPSFAIGEKTNTNYSFTNKIALDKEFIDKSSNIEKTTFNYKINSYNTNNVFNTISTQDLNNITFSNQIINYELNQIPNSVDINNSFLVSLLCSFLFFIFIVKNIFTRTQNEFSLSFWKIEKLKTNTLIKSKLKNISNITLEINALREKNNYSLNHKSLLISSGY